MDFLQASARGKKNSPLILSVLNGPSKNQLKQILSPSPEFSLFQYGQKKSTLAAYKCQIQKSKLLSNLQIYQWRCQTQFPIVKTIFVSVKQNQINSSQIVELTAFNEYCPLKLTQIYGLPLGQSLYLLKQSLIGFQRLYNRFGGFQVLNSMITINEKGFCRVWLNQNFVLNNFPKRDITQNRMVNKIITIIQSHSQDSKASKKLYSHLRHCSSFLGSLKAIDQFVKQSKIFVPTRFTSNNSVSPSKQTIKEPPTLAKTFNSFDEITAVTRFSVKQERFGKLAQVIREELKSSAKDRKHSYSPLTIKRMKSQDTINGADLLKISDGQTAYTGKRNRTSNMEGYQMSPKLQSKKNQSHYSHSPKKRTCWMEQSSYVMQQLILEEKDKTKHENKNKKELSHSLAIKQGQNYDNSDNLRKFSCKLNPEQKKNTLNSKYPYFSKKSVDEPYFAEFCDLLDRDDCENGKKIQILEQDEQKYRQDQCGKIIKNNGWVSNVSGLLNIQDQLQYSFDNGQEERTAQREIKLQKLGKLGRQLMSTSVLPQQLDSIK